jgi:hypothetical protein
MRIDPKGTIAGYPALLVRRALRQLDLHVSYLHGAHVGPAALGLGQHTPHSVEHSASMAGRAFSSLVATS